MSLELLASLAPLRSLLTNGNACKERAIDRRSDARQRETTRFAIVRGRRGVDAARRRDRGAPFSLDAGRVGWLDVEVPSKTGQTRSHNTHPSHDRPVCCPRLLFCPLLGDAANATLGQPFA